MPSVRSKNESLVDLLGGPKRVFIIGAGVSASCGIPVTRYIFGETMEFIRKKSSSDAERIEKFVRYLYPNEDQFPNLEEFLNQVVMAKQFNTAEFVRSEAWGSEKIQRVFTKTLTYTAEFIREKLKDTDRQTLIRKFVHDAIRPGDVIITFNWDTTIESALSTHPTIRRVKTRYYGTENPLSEEIVLMKPHGSIDWEPRIEFAEDKLNRRRARILEDYPLIIPPISDKQFTLPFFKKTWRSVFEAVSEADELYILGYSMPKEDQFARFVFRRALRENFRMSKKRETKRVHITVLNKDERVKETFDQLIGRSFEFLPITFEKYVREHVTKE